MYTHLRFVLLKKECNLNMLKLIVISMYLIRIKATYLALDISNSNNRFGNNIYNILSKTDGNIFFSPLSAHAVLTLCYQGATGETENIFQNILQLPEPDIAAKEYKKIIADLDKINEVILYLASNIYIQSGYELKHDFKLIANTVFMADVLNINFTNTLLAAHQINTWIESTVNHNIKNIISVDDLDEETRILLVNAVYFKGNWLHPFNEGLTQPEKFYISDIDAVDCQMMHITGKYYYVESDGLNAKILKMPYVNEHIDLVIILPNLRTSIQNLENQLVSKDLSALTQNMNLTEVRVSLPKFRLETTMEFNQPLEQLGFQDIFMGNAHFRKMIDTEESLKISKVIQKAFIEVNEKGSEAGASTGVVIRQRRSLDTFENEFQANKPFLFYIIKSNVTVIFLGKLINPNALVVHDEL